MFEFEEIQEVERLLLLTGGAERLSLCPARRRVCLEILIMANVHNPCHPSPQSQDTHAGRPRESEVGSPFILLFHQSKQLIFARPQLIWAPATQALPREKGIARLSPPPASPRPPLSSVLLGLLEEVAAD